MGRDQILNDGADSRPAIPDERAIDLETAERWARDYLAVWGPGHPRAELELSLQHRVLWLWKVRFADQAEDDAPYWIVGGDMAHMVLRGDGEDTIRTAAECLVVYCWLVRQWFAFKGQPGEDAQPLLFPGVWERIQYWGKASETDWLSVRRTFVQYTILPDILNEVRNPEVRDRMSRLGLYEGMFDPAVRAKLVEVADERERKQKSAREANQERG